MSFSIRIFLCLLTVSVCLQQAFAARPQSCLREVETHLGKAADDLNTTDRMLIEQILNQVYFSPGKRLTSMDMEVVDRFNMAKNIDDVRAAGFEKLSIEKSSRIKAQAAKWGGTSLLSGLVLQKFYADYILKIVTKDSIEDNFGLALKTGTSSDFEFLDSVLRCNPKSSLRMTPQALSDGGRYFPPSGYSDDKPPVLRTVFDVFENYILQGNTILKDYEFQRKALAAASPASFDRAFAEIDMATARLSRPIDWGEKELLEDRIEQIMRKRFGDRRSEELLFKYGEMVSELSSIKRYYAEERRESTYNVIVGLEKEVDVIRKQIAVHFKELAKRGVGIAADIKSLDKRIELVKTYNPMNRSYSHLRALWETTEIPVCSRWGTDYSAKISHDFSRALSQTVLSLPPAVVERLKGIQGIVVNRMGDYLPGTEAMTSAEINRIRDQGFYAFYNQEKKTLEIFNNFGDSEELRGLSSIVPQALSVLLLGHHVLPEDRFPNQDKVLSEDLTCYLSKVCREYKGSSARPNAKALKKFLGPMEEKKSEIYFATMAELLKTKDRSWKFQQKKNAREEKKAIEDIRFENRARLLKESKAKK